MDIGKKNRALISGTQEQALTDMGAWAETIASTEIQPSWFLVDENDELHILVTPFVGPEEFKVKETIRTLIALEIIKHNVKRYVFLSEAWALEVRENEYKKGEFIQPSKSERRREVLIMVIADKDGSKRLRNYEIVRDAENNRSLKLDNIHPDEKTGGGPMAEVFERAQRIKESLPPGVGVDSLLDMFKAGFMNLANAN